MCRLIPKVTSTTIVRGNAALHLSAGALLACGVATPVAAGALAVSMVPTTVVGHAFWRIQDPAPRIQQRIHFSKNVSIIGGLLFVAAAVPL
jgi:putative oxidoreductase